MPSVDSSDGNAYNTYDQLNISSTLSTIYLYTAMLIQYTDILDL